MIRVADVSCDLVDQGIAIPQADIRFVITSYSIHYTKLYDALATGIFCAAMARLLGATVARAGAFGILAGVGLYAVAVHLLGLNLPAGTVLAVVTGSP